MPGGVAGARPMKAAPYADSGRRTQTKAAQFLTDFLGEADNAHHHALWRHSAGR